MALNNWKDNMANEDWCSTTAITSSGTHIQWSDNSNIQWSDNMSDSSWKLSPNTASPNYITTTPYVAPADYVYAPYVQHESRDVFLNELMDAVSEMLKRMVDPEFDPTLLKFGSIEKYAFDFIMMISMQRNE